MPRLIAVEINFNEPKHEIPPVNIAGSSGGFPSHPAAPPFRSVRIRSEEKEGETSRDPVIRSNRNFGDLDFREPCVGKSEMIDVTNCSIDNNNKHKEGRSEGGGWGWRWGWMLPLLYPYCCFDSLLPRICIPSAYEMQAAAVDMSKGRCSARLFASLQSGNDVDNLHKKAAKIS